MEIKRSQQQSDFEIPGTMLSSISRFGMGRFLSISRSYQGIPREKIASRSTRLR